MQGFYHILLVEKEGNGLAFLDGHLKVSDRSFRVRRVHDLKSGISEIQNQQPDVILVDNSVPQERESELFRAESHAYAIPVILISDEVEAELATEIDRIGAIDALPKKLEGTDLHQTIMHAIEQKKTGETLNQAKGPTRIKEGSFEGILSKLSEGVVIVNGELKIVFVNNPAHHIVTLLGEKKLMNMVSMLLESNEHNSAEWTMTVNDLSAVHFELSEISYNNESHYLIVIRDTSAENDLKKKSEQFEKSYQLLYQSYPKPVLIHNHQRLIEANDLACEILKMQRGAVSGFSLNRIFKETGLFNPQTGAAVEEIEQTVTVIDQEGKEHPCQLITNTFSYKGDMVYLSTMNYQPLERKVDYHLMQTEPGMAIFEQLSALVNSNFQDDDGFIAASIDLACKILGFPFGYFGTYNDQQFKISCVVGSAEGISPGVTFDLKKSPEERVKETGKSLILQHKGQEEEAYTKYRLLAREVHTSITSPINSGPITTGAIHLFSGSDGEYQIDDQMAESVEQIAGIIGSVIDMKNRIVSLNVDQFLDKAVTEGREEIHSKHLLKLASHDLKESVRVILNYTEMVSGKLKDRENEEEINSYLDYAREGARKLEKIVEDFKFFLNMGDIQIKKVSFDANEAIESVLMELSPLIEQTGASISIGSIPVVLADRKALKTIFNQLIDNAIKFRKEGDKPLVSISCQEMEDEWLFSVRDNGIGIDRTYHAKIFDIFQRLNNQHEIPSNGMGLTICSQFVSMHGGRIWVDSLPGYGSSFYFTIKKS